MLPLLRRCVTAKVVLAAVAALLVLSPSAAAATVPAAGRVPPPVAVTPEPQGAGHLDGQIGMRFDCLHNFNIDRGSAQDCLEISGMRLTLLDHDVAQGSRVHAMMRLDPFTSPRGARADQPFRQDLPAATDTQMGIIDGYALTWLPRQNLNVALELYDGAAAVTSVSGLAFANGFADTGWRQSALTVAYDLNVPTNMHVKFAAGNGEGETVHENGPQRYFGFQVNAAVVKGIYGYLGVSLDGNNIGSEEHGFLAKRLQSGCATPPPEMSAKLGQSTQRVAAGLVLDGTLAAAEGLKLGLGWQRILSTDLDKKTAAVPSVASLESGKCRLDPDTLFVEDDNSVVANSVRRTIIDASLNYRLFGSYFIAADYTTRRVDTGKVKTFRVCDAFSGTDCVAPSGQLGTLLTQDAWTFGGGTDLAPGLSLTLEYFRATNDHTYTEVYFLGQDGKAGNNLEAFNARIGYNWQ